MHNFDIVFKGVHIMKLVTLAFYNTYYHGLLC